MFITIMNYLIGFLFCFSIFNYNLTKKLNIGVLRHINPEEAQNLNVDTYAERLMIDAANIRGHHIEFINPLDPLSVYASAHYDAIISRAEIDTFTNNVTDAYLRALHYFESLHIPIINGSNATINAQDKFRTLVLAQKAGVAIPDTYVVYSLQDLQALTQDAKMHFPFFIKKLYGGCGRGVFLINDEQELHSMLTRNFQANEPILVEERVDLETDQQGNVKDMRIWVVRDALTQRARFIGGAYRIAADGHYLTNIYAGGSVAAIPQPYPEDLMKFSEQALESIGADVAGIDVARDKNGNLYLLEINISFYTTRSIADIIGVNIWELVMDLVETRAHRGILS